jgi:predicted metal-dependent hydrolase
LTLTKKEQQVTIGNRVIPYTLKVSTRAKRMRMTIANGELSVTVPGGLRFYSVERFIQEHGEWILAKLAQGSKRKPMPTLPKDVILVRGTPMRIERIEESNRKSRARIEMGKDRVIVRVPAGSRAYSLGIVEAWLRDQAREVIGAEVNRQAARMRARPTGLTIRDQRTRWGSCSSKGTLSFNWRLVMAPPEVMSYVVIHELGHLFHANHSKDFWAVVAGFCPDFKKHRAWLRKNASLLRPQH